MRRFAHCILIAIAIVILAILCCSSAPKPDIASIMKNNGHFKIAAKLVKVAGLESAVNDKGPVTVFAPTDAAFAKLPRGTVDKLLKPENKAQLVSILMYHAARGRVTTGSAKNHKCGVTVITMEGATVKLTCKGKCIKVNDAVITSADISATNGILHILNKVLIPPKEKEERK